MPTNHQILIMRETVHRVTGCSWRELYALSDSDLSDLAEQCEALDDDEED